MNPYRHDTLLAGMLGREDRFIGLREELEWLLARVSDTRPKAISLVGPWGIGKSFMLQFLAHPQGARRAFAHMIGPQFRADPDRLLFVTVDFEDPAPGDRAPTYLLDLLYTQTLASLADLLQIPDARLIPLEQVPTCRQTAVADLRAQIQWELTNALDAADEPELRAQFESTLGATLPDKLITLLKYVDGWGLRVVFLIDRFDNVAAQLDRATFDHLRALLPVASLVIATRKALSEQVPGEAQTSPFFNLLERLGLMSLHFLSEDEARRMITEPPTWFPETADMRFSASDVDFILELTGLHPDMLRASCEYLYTWIRRRRTTPTAEADMLPLAERRYLRALLRAQFDDFFAVLWHTLSPEECAMLIRIAARTITIDERQDIPPPPALSMVIKRGYVVFEAGRYRLFAGLFHDYVRDQALTASPAEQPGPPVALTELESKFLELLKARPGDTVDRAEIITRLYGVKPDNTTMRHYGNRLDTLISRLRAKIEGEPMLIENVRGQGYRLVWTR